MAKAWFYNEYGSADVLQFGEIEAPNAGPGQVLIEVRAAALNPVDFMMRPADAPPFLMVPEWDLAGVVAGVDDGVSKFKKGDQVYGNIHDFTAGNPVIDPKSLYAFSDVVKTSKHLKSRRARGKSVISPRAVNLIMAFIITLAFIFIIAAAAAETQPANPKINRGGDPQHN